MTSPSYSPPSVASGHGPNEGRRAGFGAVVLGSPQRRIVTSVVLLALAAIGGVYFKFEPGPTPVDRLAFGILPSEWSVHYLTYVADLGRPRVVVPAVVLCFVIAMFWDKRRAGAVAVAPPVAIGITEYIGKPAVGRMFGGSLCYPSGHMTAVAAVVAVLVIAVPPRLRYVMLVFGVLVDILVAIVLMLLRWHYLTDICAGAFISIGTTLFLDTLVHARFTNRPALQTSQRSREPH